MGREIETDSGNEEGTTEKCKRVEPSLERLTADGLKHLSEEEIDKLMKEEPEITVKGYIEFLKEIQKIEKSF